MTESCPTVQAANPSQRQGVAMVTPGTSAQRPSESDSSTSPTSQPTRARYISKVGWMRGAEAVPRVCYLMEHVQHAACNDRDGRAHDGRDAEVSTDRSCASQRSRRAIHMSSYRREVLEEHGMPKARVDSVAPTDCYDNATTQSLWVTLKKELVSRLAPRRGARSLNGLKFGISANERTAHLVFSAPNSSRRPGELGSSI